MNKFLELVSKLQEKGYFCHTNKIKEIASYSDRDGAYTFLIYYAKRIDKSLIKGHKLPEVVHSLITCSRCGGEGGSEKWNHTGRACYNCYGKGKVLGSQVSFRREMKSIAENTEIITLKQLEEKKTQTKEERTFKVEYFLPIKPEAYETIEFKVSELTNTTWIEIEKFVSKKLKLQLRCRNKQKTMREYDNSTNNHKWIRIVF